MAKRAEPLAPRPERIAAFGLGISAESRAAAYLVAKGFRILSRRWKSPLGELDIVARRRKLLIFVEVKARATLDAAAESIDARTQRRIAAAAEAWLATYPQPNVTDMRFDAMLVAPGKIPRHIQGAFESA
jgi:putative endonuclease